jgi:hypothetical protein
VLALACLVSGWAQAAEPELLVSVERVSPSGVEVAVGVPTELGWGLPTGEVSLSVKGGTASRRSPAPLPAWRVIPERGARTLELTAKVGGRTLRRSLPVGAPAPEVGLSLFPEAPVKGRDREARLTVKLVDAEGKPWPLPAPPVLRASVGEVEDVRRIGPGLFEARYLLPTTRYPEVAVLVAFAPWPHPDAPTGVAGALRVALATEVELPGSSEPGARLTLEIADRTFGPITVGEDGRFKVPVIVPPGAGIARSTVRDQHGNRRVERIDLRLPPVDPLACVVQPARLPADGRSHARVLCALSDSQGQPETRGVVRLKAERGSLQGPTQAPGGLMEWQYTSPAQAFGTDTLQGASRGRGVVGQELLRVTELPRPAAALTVESSEDVLHRGASTQLTVHARDAQGKPTPDARLEVTVRPGAASTEGLGSSGEANIRWSAPLEAEGERAEVTLEAWGPTRDVPARLWAWHEGNRLHVKVTDPAGLPVPDAPLWVQGEAHTTDARGRLELPLPEARRIAISHRDWTGLQLHLHRVERAPVQFFPESRPPRATTSLMLPLGPPLPVNVRVTVSGRTLRFWAEIPGGGVVPDRELVATGSAGRLPAARRGEDGVYELQLPEGAQLITVSDPQSGVTVATRVAP